MTIATTENKLSITLDIHFDDNTTMSEDFGFFSRSKAEWVALAIRKAYEDGKATESKARSSEIMSLIRRVDSLCEEIDDLNDTIADRDADIDNLERELGHYTYEPY